MKRFIFVLMLSIASVNLLNAQVELDSLIKNALVHHAGLQSKMSAYELSMERANAAGAWDDPRISAGYFIQPVETRTGPQKWRFSISQMFPWFGTRDAEADYYGELAYAAYLDIVEQRTKIIMEIKSEYFTLWTLHRLIELNELHEELLESLEELARTRFSSGTGRLSDYNRIKISRQGVKNEIEIGRKELVARYESLHHLLQYDPDTLHFTDEIPELQKSATLPDSLPLSPAHQAIKANQRAASLEQEMIRRKGMPSLGFGVDYILIGKRDDAIVSDNGKNALMPMVTVSLPIWRRKFNSARRMAELREEKFDAAARQQQADLYTELELVIFQVEKALSDFQLANEQEGLMEDTMELVETDFANDKASLFDLLRIQEDLLLFRKNRLNAQLSYLKGSVEYEYLTFQGVYEEYKIEQENE